MSHVKEKKTRTFPQLQVELVALQALDKVTQEPTQMARWVRCALLPRPRLPVEQARHKRLKHSCNRRLERGLGDVRPGSGLLSWLWGGVGGEGLWGGVEGQRSWHTLACSSRTKPHTLRDKVSEFQAVGHHF